MADNNSDNRGSLEEREKATKELFERDITSDVNRKDLQADDVLGSDHLEIAQTDIGMAEQADDRQYEDTTQQQVVNAVELEKEADIGSDSNKNTDQYQQSENRISELDNISSDRAESATEMPSVGEKRPNQAQGVAVESQQLDSSKIDSVGETGLANADWSVDIADPSYELTKVDLAASPSRQAEPEEASASEVSDQVLVVANLMLVNSEPNEEYSYEIIGPGSDYFDIIENQLVVKSGINLDNTQTSSHSLTFQITDRAGNRYQEVVEINLDLNREEAVIVLNLPEAEEDAVVEEATVPSVNQTEASDDHLTYTLVDQEMAPAGFVLHEDGSYDLDVTHEAYQHLGLGESQTLVVPVEMSNSQGEITTAEIQIVITGSNDLPVVEPQQHDAISEGSSVIEGRIHATDVDNNALMTFTVSDGFNAPLGFELSQDGHYSFSAENHNDLGVGESRVVEIPITVSDEHGGSADTTLSITISGTNDSPIATAQQISTDDTGYVIGQLQASDVDLAEGSELSFSTSSEVEGLILNEDGSYSFDASSYQTLGAGETEAIEVPITVSDDQGATAETVLTLTITGTNDVPVVDLQQVAIDEGNLITGQLQASDVDLAEGAELTFASTSEIDGLVINGDGSYSFDASSYQALGEGETETIEVPITVSDDQGATTETVLTLTITGTNDVPVVDLQQVAIDEGDLITGQLQASDIDLAEGSELSFSTSSEVEGLTFNEDGSYSFDASSYQALGAGETEAIEVPITVSDDQGATTETVLTLTITGTNDAPVVDAQHVALDEGDLITGQLQASDIDLAKGSGLSFSTSSEVEGLILNEDGSYSFDASSYQTLGEGETEAIEVSITVSDDQGATAETVLTLTITGTNDVPVVDLQQVAIDEGNLITGQLQASDVDLAEGAELTFASTSEIDGLVINGDGSYSFDASSYQSLGEGETEAIEVPVTVSDDQGASADAILTLTITGTNDVPVVDLQQVAVDEGDLITGQLQASDIDLAEGSMLSFSTSSEVEGLTFSEDGSYSFDASSYQALGEGETETIEVPVTVSDDQGASADTILTLTITGTNDVPVVDAQQIAVDEGGIITGQLQASDIDLAEGAQLTFASTSEIDGLVINEDGSYSFDASSYQALGEGETETIEVPVTVSDDQGASADTILTLAITGTNDVPVVDAQHVALDEGDLITGQLQASDIDLAEGSMLSFSTSSEVEGLTFNEDGSYSFDASSYQALGEGETETIEVPITVSDDQGATAETVLTFTITGTNDVPVVDAQQIAVDESGLITGQLQASDIDLAEGAQLTFASTSEIDGLVINDDGSYSFNATLYQALGEGETETIEVPVTVSDDQGATADTVLTLTITGTNDVPVVDAQQVAVDEGDLITGQLQASDVDLAEGSELSFSTSSEVEGLTLNEDGSYSFDASSYEALGAGETQTIEVPVTVTDDLGGRADTNLTISVTGSNDLPTVSAVETVANEGEIITGQLEADDIDLPDGASLTFSTDVSIDGLMLNADGTYSFDTSHYDKLDSGETEIIEVPVIVEDDQGSKAETTLTINVQGEDHEAESSGDQVGSGHDEKDEHRGRGDRDDQEEHRGRGNRDDREEHRGRGDREDREEHQGRGDRDDLEENRGRGNRDDREEHRGRGDRDDREENRGRGNQDEQEEHRGRGNRDDREEHRGRGNRDDREEHRGRGDRDDREEHRGRGNRDDREEHRGRGNRDEREEHRGRGNRDEREEHRGRSDQEDREHHRGWGQRDDWAEHPHHGENGGQRPGHRFHEGNNEQSASPTDIELSGGVVEEGASSGTVVATLSAIDEDSGEQFSYDLVRDDSGHFEIVGDQLVVTQGADIDYENSSAHQISIRVTDSTGNTFTETIAINVADVQEAMSAADEEYANADEGDDSDLMDDSEDLDHGDEVDDDSGLASDSDFHFSDDASELADGRDFDDSHDLDHDAREEDSESPFDGADYFDEAQGEGWTDVVQLNPEADPNADPSNPWAISQDGEQVQYDIADNALSVNPETSSQITFSDGSELTIEGVERIEW